MAKTTATFICQSCGAVTNRWMGKCESCGEWNSIAEESTPATPPKGLSHARGHTLTFVPLDGDIQDTPRITTGISELDRVLGGGFVQGSATLIGGDPGIGKSTILLQAVAALAGRNQRCAYISGEESVMQVKLRANRLGLAHEAVQLATATSVRDIVTTLDHKDHPDIVVIDSIQTMFMDNIESAPGTVTQVRASTQELIRLGKHRNIAFIFVGHVTKDGQIAGPRVLEHMVDTVLYFEGERGHQFRILRAVKNRFGGTDEIGVFEMTDGGLKEVSNPSSLFLSQREGDISGSAVFAGMEGSRPLLMEVQALVAPTSMATPRRAVVGWDSGRLAMILAVFEARCGIAMHTKEVYLNVAGGLRINEPAADLAIAAALLSALSDIPPPPHCIIFGEIGLSGEIRTVSRSETRLKESEKLGFTDAIIPYSSPCKGTAIRVQPLQHIRDLVELFAKGN